MGRGARGPSTSLRCRGRCRRSCRPHFEATYDYHYRDAVTSGGETAGEGEQVVSGIEPLDVWPIDAWPRENELADFCCHPCLPVGAVGWRLGVLRHKLVTLVNTNL